MLVSDPLLCRFFPLMDGCVMGTAELCWSDKCNLGIPFSTLSVNLGWLLSRTSVDSIALVWKGRNVQCHKIKLKTEGSVGCWMHWTHTKVFTTSWTDYRALSPSTILNSSLLTDKTRPWDTWMEVVRNEKITPSQGQFQFLGKQESVYQLKYPIQPWFWWRPAR